MRTVGGAQVLGLTIAELDELVAAAGVEGDDRVEEWRWYRDYLRRQARPDGSIPRDYRLLVRLVFGDVFQFEDDQPSSAVRNDST